MGDVFTEQSRGDKFTEQQHNYPDLEVQFALIPKGPDGTTSSVVGGQNVVVFEGSEHKVTAMEWARFLLSEEAQLKMAERGVIPTLKPLAGNPALPDYFAVFIVYPMVYSLRISFYDWNIILPQKSTFVGLDNYTGFLTDPIFRRAVINTLSYTAITVPGQMILALIVAVLLDQEIKGKTFFRVAYYLPVITSWVIVTLVFEYLFNSQAGLINYVLRDVLHVVDHSIRWMADPILVMVPVNILGIWKGVGWSAIILLAALQEIPSEMLEAAAVDGAGPWRRLWHITLPLLRPTLVFLLVVLVIGGSSRRQTAHHRVDTRSTAC
ncbi:MAG: extracellular solute-binding protein [Chloroflexota bacterium]|nr:extracellular solute-binding protein [Chloroflexota bacterium]